LICNNCGRKLPDDWTFCMHCGGKAVPGDREGFCPKCGLAVPEEAAFCKRCGTRLSAAPAPVAPMPPEPAAPPVSRMDATLWPSTEASGLQRRDGAGMPAFVWWLIGGAVLAAAALVLVIALSLSHNPAKPAALEGTATPAARATLAATAAPRTDRIIVPAGKPDLSETVELQWYVLGGYNEPDGDYVLSEVNDYLLGKINAKVDLHALGWGEYDDKVSILLASKQPFDLAFTSLWMTDYFKNSRAGNFMELDALLEAYGGDITRVLGEDYLRAASVDGRLYGLPVNACKCHGCGIFLRKDLADMYEVNTEDIRSLEDLSPVFARVKAGGKGVYPLFMSDTTSPYDLLDWNKLSDYNVPGALYSNASPLNATVLNDLTAPESVAAYKLARSYREMGYFDESDTGEYYSDAVGSGKYFSFISGSMRPGMEYDLRVSTGYDWVPVRLSPPVMSGYDAVNCLLAIPAAAENPERAMALCNLLYTDAYLLNMLDFGIEGVHYAKTADDAIKVNDGAGYNPGISWEYGNQLLTYREENDVPGKWELWEAENGRAVRINSLGFWFDGARVGSEEKACSAVYAKYCVDLFCGTGAEDVDAAVSSMKKELRDAGADALIAEMQRQFDAWNR
jgi:putative aldouronate transport system substrate-binding protein